MRLDDAVGEVFMGGKVGDGEDAVTGQEVGFPVVHNLGHITKLLIISTPVTPV